MVPLILTAQCAAAPKLCVLTNARRREFGDEHAPTRGCECSTVRGRARFRSRDAAQIAVVEVMSSPSS